MPRPIKNVNRIEMTTIRITPIIVYFISLNLGCLEKYSLQMGITEEYIQEVIIFYPTGSPPVFLWIDKL